VSDSHFTFRFLLSGQSLRGLAALTPHSSLLTSRSGVAARFASPALRLRSRSSLRCGSLAFFAAALLFGLQAGCGGDDCCNDEIVELDVAFDSTPPEGVPATLCGTLTLPGDTSGPLPGVVLLPGPEPMSRNGSIAAVPLFDRQRDALDGALDGRLAFSPAADTFRDIARFLAAKGYAVLRYDSRTWLAQQGSTCGQPPASGPFTTYHSDFLADSMAAVDFLKSRSEVLSTRVFVIGHGLGASLALQQAAMPGRLRGVVLLAAGARAIDTLLIEHLQRRIAYLRSLPSSPALEEAIAGAQAQLAAAQSGFPIVRAGRWPITELLLSWGKFYWESWVQVTDRNVATARAVRVPMLFLHGSMDFAVPSTELTRFAGLQGATLQELPGLTHAFTSVSTVSFERTVSPLLLNFMGDWLQAH
jgi:pimeloyl-ACP methyl ester carboxylesterase